MSAALAFKAAELQEQAFTSAEQRISVWRALLERSPESDDALERVTALLEDEGRHGEIAATLKAAADRSDPKRAAELLSRMGSVQFNKLDNQAAALESLSRALRLDPDNQQAVAVLEDAMRHGTERAAAASVLEELARRGSRQQLLVDVLIAKAELTTEASERAVAEIETFDLLSGPLSDPERALGLAKRALAGALHDELLLKEWLKRLAELKVADEHSSLKARVLAGALAEEPIRSEALFALALGTADALLASGDFDAAIAVFERALPFAPTRPDAALGLDRVRGLPGP
jgi:tetratricopeptide (TPR) repeat protein